MATVSSFEGLQPPTRSELRQFAELFSPLFVASSDDAKRQAVAALSQCATIPQAVALFIGCQPISISAPFLISSPAIDDDTLIAVARMQGVEHMRAIVSRDALSPRVIDVLVGLRHATLKRPVDAVESTPAIGKADVAEALADAAMSFAASVTHQPAPVITGTAPVAVEVQTVAADAEVELEVAETINVLPVEPAHAAEAPPAAPEQRSAPSMQSPAPSQQAGTAVTDGGREEEVRDTLRGLARHLGRDDNDRLGIRTLSTLQSALLVRFARGREAVAFATALADTLSASRWLSERIMLDTSGQQMATTLTSIGMDFSDAVFVLEKLYPHLAEAQHSVTRAWMVLDALDSEECRDRVEAWRRADNYTYLPEQAPAAPHPVTQQTAHGRAIHQPPPRAMRLVGRSR